MPLRVVVGEDSYLVREGILRALEQDERVQAVGAEADLDGLRDAVERLRPDVVVTDIRMPPTETDEGIVLAEELLRDRPEIGVVVLSQHAQASYAATLFSAGASRRAYLLKDRIAEPTTLVDAIESVARGTPMLDSKVVALLLDQRSGDPLADLTERERQVLRLVADGRSNAAIAQELVVTRRAVERHINSIFAKLDLLDSDAINRRVLAALLYARSAA